MVRQYRPLCSGHWYVLHVFLEQEIEVDVLFQIVAVYIGGVGRHLAAITQSDPSKEIKWGQSVFAFDLLYCLAANLPKISTLTLYLRIFTKGKSRLACYVLIFVEIAAMIAYTGVAIFGCTPVAYQWDRSIQGGSCIDFEALFKTTSAPQIVTDIAIMILPIPTVANLQASTSRKIGILAIFLVGSL